MSEMSHDNIAVFIGASVDVDHVCLILKFYPKGSLQDVIHNDEIQLDDTFKLSIATDMINVSVEELNRLRYGKNTQNTWVWRFA